jgi:hypothetical protein
VARHPIPSTGERRTSVGRSAVLLAYEIQVGSRLPVSVLVRRPRESKRIVVVRDAKPEGGTRVTWKPPLMGAMVRIQVAVPAVPEGAGIVTVSVNVDVETVHVRPRVTTASHRDTEVLQVNPGAH